MTEHTDKVEARRFQLFKESTDLPTLETKAGWNYTLKRYPSGKLIKVFDDKRKKDQVINEGENNE